MSERESARARERESENESERARESESESERVPLSLSLLFFEGDHLEVTPAIFVASLGFRVPMLGCAGRWLF